MPKLIILVRRRPDLSHEEFVRHYEERHVPLVLSLMPISGYRRNYVARDTAFVAAQIEGVTNEVDFDVLTEIWFESEGDLLEAQRTTAGEAGWVLSEDEKKIFDLRPGAVRFLVVDERITSADEISAARYARDRAADTPT